ncbi:MAG: CAP domain-containing protein [Acutalibacteraceae bacterium]
MFYKKLISFLMICLIFSLVLSGCRNTADYSSSSAAPSGENLTHSEVSSDDTSSDVTVSDPEQSSQISSEYEQSSQESSVIPSNPVNPPASSTASHLHSFKVERVDPTCTEDGYTIRRCVECGETKIDDYVPKKGHTFVEWKTVTEPTQTSVGLRERVCTVCNEKQTEEIPIPVSALSKEVLDLVNQERRKAGKAELTYRQDLQICANIRAKEITDLFNHTRPNGSECFTVFAEHNIEYNTMGENIASGQSTPQDVMKSWMNSDAHKKIYFRILLQV